ncbi:MAG: hypothetical protein P9E24_01390 [Candidatus Competibacter sp.]|nr:hypothetical protein [Candidatus Competibacter sp.]MDG4583406.1 hypothetical protein [Candidatus Competibacter sp.]
MASTITPYTHYWGLIHTAGVDLSSATIKVALVSSGYTFSAAHTIFDPGTDDAADPSYNEVASGGGYTTGGITLANGSSHPAYIGYDNPAWVALTKTFRGAIFYFSGSVGGLTDPLIAYLLFDSTPADIMVTNSSYVIALDLLKGLFYNPAAYA